MTEPYYRDELTELYLGDCRDLLPELAPGVALVVADPPYERTGYRWDRWPDGWPGLLAEHMAVSASLWCFGSMRLFMERAGEFLPVWKFAQDIVWEKHNGSSTHNDRFRRVHESVNQFFRGAWADLEPAPPYVESDSRPGVHRRKRRPAHWIADGQPGRQFSSSDGGPRLVRSVIRTRSLHGVGVHPTQKPLEVLDEILRCSDGIAGPVLDPFAGAASTLVAARARGRRSIGIEADERYIEKAAQRLAQRDLFAAGA